MQETLIDQIITLEWTMFVQVQNAGGSASCQENPQTFRIMRHSQCVTWSEAVLLSYLDDLQIAQAAGRNLLTEKYARMMAYTYPADYAQIKDQLPPISAQTLQQIDDIVAINLTWVKEADQRYPHVRAKGRPTTSADDSATDTSLETYLRCELQTYSSTTIDLYHQYTRTCLSTGRNLADENLTDMVKAYGCHSLTEAEQRMQL